MTEGELQELLRKAYDEAEAEQYDEAEKHAHIVLSAFESSVGMATHHHRTVPLVQSPDEPCSYPQSLRAEALRLLGVVDWRHGKIDASIERLQAAIRISESSRDVSIIARVTTTLGNVYAENSDYHGALECYARALAMHEQYSNKRGMADCFGGMGNAYMRISDYPKAVEYSAKALSIHEEVGDEIGIARSLAGSAAICMDMSDYPRALEFQSKALAIYEELDDRRGKCFVTGDMGVVYWLLSDFPAALECLNRSLALCQESGDTFRIASALGNIGLVYASFSDYKKALECFAEALSLYETVDNPHGLAHIAANIGNVYFSLNDYPKALEYSLRVLPQFEKLGDKGGTASSLMSIGNAYAGQSDDSTALKFYERALSLLEEIGDKRNYAFVVFNMATIYEKQHKYERSLECCYQALQTFEEVGELENVAKLKSGIAEIYANKNWSGHDEAKAEEFVRDAITVSRELGIKNYQAHKTLSQIYKSQQRWQECQEQFELYHNLKEEVFSNEAKKSAELLEHNRISAERDKLLSVERMEAKATQKVLHQVLPPSIADRLVKGEKVADYFQHVSILFADIVGFTPIASRMPAKVVLAFLNFVFGEFDKIVRKHGCEKIKTIGDGYMAIGGAPQVCDDHAERIARCALDLMNDIHLPDEIRKHLPQNAVFSIRIGIHTGSAFAGIVGDERFVYDIYSDAVNIAARMESHGEAGRIHCSNDFALHLQNRDDSFVFTERGELEIKGKGMMRTYFLEKA